MERAAFDKAVERIEQRYQGRTRELARSARRWLWLGYASITGSAVVIGSIGVALIWFGTSLSSVGVLMIIAGSLAVAYGMGQLAQLILVHNTLPTEISLDLEKAAPLATAIEQLRQTLDAEPLARVCIDHQFNAYVVQNRPLGILNGLATPGSRLANWFPSVNVLVIGLPLMMILTEQEFRALLAHELGHISGRHGRKRGHVYHLRQQWQQFFLSLQTSTSATLRRLLWWMHGTFVSWYWPRLDARTFVLSRYQEYEADQCSVACTDVSTTAALLWKVHVLGRYYDDECHERLWQSLATSSLPPNNYLERILASIASPNQDAAAQAIGTSLRRLTDNSDTHPCLNDRVKVLVNHDDNSTLPPDLNRFLFPSLPEVSAAQSLLGEHLQIMSDAVDEQWYQHAVAHWKSGHRRLMAVASIADHQDTDSSDMEISVDEIPATWEKALELLDVRGYKAAEPLVRAVLAAEPDHAGALCAMGGIAIAKGDDRAEDLLSFVIDKKDRIWTPRAAEVLMAHYANVGEKEKLVQLRCDMDQYDKLRQQADAERAIVSTRDVLAEHGLGPEHIAALTETLQQNESCVEGFLVRKEVEHLPEEPMFVLCVESDSDLDSAERSRRNERMVTWLMLRLQLPGRTLIVTPTGHHAAAGKRVASMDRSRIFSKQEDENTE